MRKIVPNLWFAGNASEAVDFYTLVFKDGKIISTSYYPEEGIADFQKPLIGKVLTIDFELNGQRFVAINAGNEFKFTEAVSFAINCENQEEIDYYWSKLTEGGDEKSQICGWLKDKYGLSWQVVPKQIFEMSQEDNPEKYEKMMKAMLQMKKIDLKTLLEAYNS